MLNVENVSFHYPGRAETVKNVSFELGEGQFLAILGNNGVGKSTLLKCLSRILTPKSGQILLDGEDLLHLPSREAAKRTAFVAQSVPDTQLTVHDTVMLGRRPYMKWGNFTEADHLIVHGVMHRLKLHGEIQGRFLNSLSGGERQKVMLARALAQQPKLLLLDEPTSSLDINNQYQALKTIRDICRSDNISAIIVIHDLNLALRFCSRFLLMKQGEIYSYGDKSVLDRAALKAVYGVEAKIVNIEDKYTVLVEQ